MHKFVFVYTLFISLIGIQACTGNREQEPKPAVADSQKTEPKKKKETETPVVNYRRPPIVNIVDSLTPDRTVVYCNDSSATFDGMHIKLGNLYSGKLAEYIKNNKLNSTGAPMAWIKTSKAPYFFEAGIPVNKTGGKAVKGVMIRKLKAGHAVIAHFYGPYDLLPQGHEAIKEFIKDNKKRTAGASYEIYLTDPAGKEGKPVDPYKVQTDIVFPVK